MDSYFGYIEQIDDGGWLTIKFDDGLIWSLPEYTQVHVKSSNGRETFEVLEGRFFGKKASVKKKGWRWDQWDIDRSYFEEEVHLKEGCIHTDAAQLRFYKKSKILEVTGLGSFKAMTDPKNPIPDGTYDIELPYEPHKSSFRYEARANYYRTWFRVGNSGDRFLHCGNISAGCLTVTDIDKWDAIYKHLIISRNDFNSIGTVKVLNL